MGFKKTIRVRTERCSSRTGTTTAAPNLEKGSILSVHLGDEALCMTILLRDEIKDAVARCIERLQYCTSTLSGSAGFLLSF